MYKFPGGLIGEIPTPANIWQETLLGNGTDLATLKGIKFQEYIHVCYSYMYMYLPWLQSHHTQRSSMLLPDTSLSVAIYWYTRNTCSWPHTKPWSKDTEHYWGPYTINISPLSPSPSLSLSLPLSLSHSRLEYKMVVGGGGGIWDNNWISRLLMIVLHNRACTSLYST